jgi:hypothetical protein
VGSARYELRATGRAAQRSCCAEQLIAATTPRARQNRNGRLYRKRASESERTRARPAPCQPTLHRARTAPPWRPPRPRPHPQQCRRRCGEAVPAFWGGSARTLPSPKHLDDPPALTRARAQNARINADELEALRAANAAAFAAWGKTAQEDAAVRVFDNIKRSIAAAAPQIVAEIRGEACSAGLEGDGSRQVVLRAPHAAVVDARALFHHDMDPWMFDACEEHAPGKKPSSMLRGHRRERLTAAQIAEDDARARSLCDAANAAVATHVGTGLRVTQLTLSTNPTRQAYMTVKTRAAASAPAPSNEVHGAATTSDWYRWLTGGARAPRA